MSSTDSHPDLSPTREDVLALRILLECSRVDMGGNSHHNRPSLKGKPRDPARLPPRPRRRSRGAGQGVCKEKGSEARSGRKDTFVVLMNEGPNMDKKDIRWSGIKHGEEGARAGENNGASSGDFRTLKPP
ncbi:hypothetical protein ZWY2020_006277 [Hordeum vulgare]|nr:hypothetical protein ZWY2020_006277 [Hordeum vulgare]